LVPRFSKVGGDASHGSRRVVSLMPTGDEVVELSWGDARIVTGHEQFSSPDHLD